MTDYRPSAAATWLNCAGAIEAQRGIPDSSGTEAREGSAAHVLGDWSLSTGRDAGERVGDAITVEGETFVVGEEMADGVCRYVEYCQALDLDYAFTEQRVDFSAIIPAGTGTSDYCGYRFADKSLHVVDLKYGRGVPVSAVDNEQLQLYALGLWFLFRGVWPIESVVVHIVQPRRNTTSSASYTVQELIAFGQRVEAAYQASIQPNPPRTPGVKQCRWCRARGNCMDLAASNIQLIQSDRISARDPIEPDPPGNLDDNTLARILDAESAITGWLKAVNEEARRRLEGGQPVPGFKLVQKYGNRTWADEEKAVKVLKRRGLKVADLYQKKLITPAQAETAAYKVAKAKAEAAGEKPPPKKSILAALAELCDRRPFSAPSVVPDTDPGEALTPDQDFAEAFADTE